MDGLIALFTVLVGLLVMNLAAVGFGTDSRSQLRPTDQKDDR
jgi:hypothetical protein